jgi:hypothetical protein
MNIHTFLHEHTIIEIGNRLPGYLCCEVIVDNPELLIPVVRENGFFISEIRWWHRTEIALGSSIGYGGPRDPNAPDRLYFAETDISMTFDALSDDDEYIQYIAQTKSKYALLDLVPAFDIKES